MAGTDLVGDAETTAFAQRWFDLLSAHVPVEELLQLVSERDLEMEFPEASLRDYDDFRRWYAAVGKAYRDQSHTVERLDAKRDGDAVHVEVTVVWQATQTSDNVTIRQRVHQQWQLREQHREHGDGLVIEKYLVGELVPV
jgi:SnoaL-like domain